MRILSISVTVPFPPDHATRLRSWHLLRGLSTTDEVVVLTWRGANDHPDAVARVAELTEELLVAPIADDRVRVTSRTRRHMRSLLGGLPPFVQHLREQRGFGRSVPPIVQRAMAMHHDRPFDFVIAESDAAPFLAPPIDVPLVVHRHNVFTETLGAMRRGWQRLGWPIERDVWRRFDRRSRGDLLVATTPECAQALHRMIPGVPLAVVPQGVEVVGNPARPDRGRYVTFIGTLDYQPNVEGLEWFARTAWRRVRLQVPDAELLVVGRHDSRRLANLSGDGVRLIGYVPDLDDVLGRTRAGVVPLRAGMGMKTKTLDLLGRGIPVISTSTGAEGIPNGPDTGLTVTDDPEGLAEELVALLRDPALAADRGRRARDLVSQRFSWDTIAAGYRSALESALTRTSEVPRS